MKWFKENTTNLQKMYVIKVLRGGMFCIATLVLFFKQNGLSLSEFMLLQSLFAIAVAILEVPTGYFADNYGKKEAIIFGAVFSAFGYLIYCVSSSFVGFFAGEMSMAVGFSFISGADSALIYKHTDVSKGHREAIKTEGNGAGVGMLSEAITSFVGGSFLALVSLRFPIYFDILLFILVIPVALTLEEEKKKKPEKGEIKRAFGEMRRIMKFSLCDHIEIKWLILYSGIVSSSTLTMVWVAPIFWETTKTPIFMFGALWSSLLLVAAFTSKQAVSLEEFLGRRTSLIVLIIMPVLGCFLMGMHVSKWASVFLIFFYITRGMNGPIMKSYVNVLIPEKDRATVLSVMSFASRAPFIILGPLVGVIHDHYSMKVALLSCAGLFAAIGFIALLFLHKNKVL